MTVRSERTPIRTSHLHSILRAVGHPPSHSEFLLKGEVDELIGAGASQCPLTTGVEWVRVVGIA